MFLVKRNSPIGLKVGLPLANEYRRGFSPPMVLSLRTSVEAGGLSKVYAKFQTETLSVYIGDCGNVM